MAAAKFEKIAARLNVFILFAYVNVVNVSAFRQPENMENKEEIHCYCNMPECITSSYMCKSYGTKNGCFKKFDPSAGEFHYGCLNTNNAAVEDIYLDNFDDPQQRRLYELCYHHMCNNAEMDKMISHSAISPQTNGNFEKMDPPSVDVNFRNNYVKSDMWFKAAMIAIPICGVLIFIFLMSLAIKLLKSEMSCDAEINVDKSKKYKFSSLNLSGAKDFLQSSQTAAKGSKEEPSPAFAYCRGVAANNARPQSLIPRQERDQGYALGYRCDYDKFLGVEGEKMMKSYDERNLLTDSFTFLKKGDDDEDTVLTIPGNAIPIKSRNIPVKSGNENFRVVSNELKF